MIRSLELHGAARRVDHNTAGKDWTYTVEGRWGIIQDIALRADYTRAIRAPAITEIFNPSSQFFGFATDPCDRNQTNQGPDPATRAANCAAAGIPVNFASLSNQRSFSQAIAGNVGLDNEKSKTFSAGVVLSPRFIRGLTLSADYIDSSRTRSVPSRPAKSPRPASIRPIFPNNEFCDPVQRDPATNQLSFIETRNFNASDFRYPGILGSLDCRIKTPFLGARSEVGLNVSYQYLRTPETRSDANSEPTELDCSIGYPKHSAVVNLNYTNGPLGLFTSINYTGKVKVDPQAPANTYDFPNRKAVAFINSGVSYDIGKRMTFRFVVDNILDTKPPFPSPANGGSVSYFPGILGRFFRAGVAVHF
jgi:outer membrane receptor protein involved in Fe transport